MDYILEMTRSKQNDLVKRLEEYNESVLVMSHDGDLPEIDGFHVVRVTTFRDMVLAEKPAIVAIGADATELAEVLGTHPLTVGLNIINLFDVAGQKPNMDVSSWLASLRDVSFVKILNDIADDELVKENMTKDELNHSAAKKQMDQIKTKDGSVRELIDFDRSFNPEDEGDQNATADGR